ncbi:triosephosphate isomerase [Haloechinothrix alba]|uniref:Triosephosphate isomerase n=1 Tax=Haloechinothrix alba TaxID=664784 RepID=A0A238WXA2_9PSEU|nr:triose-phosphate isomerase [Haloechinothrix alba]SNR51108.1 triosephosphate isomerase [Haloechinothrix alba]
MTDKPLIAGNWKMHLNHLEAIALVQKIAFTLPEKYFNSVDVAVLPPFTDIRSVQTLIEGDKLSITHGAQDVSAHESGAYTGEVSGAMLAKLGCSFVVVGHSERREHHDETDELVNAKVRATLSNGMAPVLCVGESLEVREQNAHLEHTTEQLRAALKGVSAEQAGNCVVAYEPVWAIGTGRVATPADAEEVCAALRERLAGDYGEEVARRVRVLYGGSVKSKNIGELVQQSNIDGALVGGASLDAEEFTKLCALAAGGPLP